MDGRGAEISNRCGDDEPAMQQRSPECVGMEGRGAETSNRCGDDEPAMQQRGGNSPSATHSRRAFDLQVAAICVKVPAAADAWSAFNIALSALFYLFDFVTNVLTLRTYYLYSVLCHKLESSTHKECNVIWEGHGLTTVFYLCLSLMAAAHLSNTLIFWVTLDPSEHPLRLAYFLPLIHLSRLLKVLWRTCRCSSLEDLRDRRRKESSSLYNVLAASLETAPQLMLQFHVVSQFGEYDLDNNYDYTVVPKTLVLSMLASVVSVTYNGSVAVLSLLLQKLPAGIMHPQLRWKACIAVLIGLHIIAAVSTQTLITTALADGIFPVMIVTWIFFAFALQKSQHDSTTCTRNNHTLWMRWMIHGVHSLALAHVSIFIGPMYVIVKLFNRPTCFLVWDTLLDIFMKLLGFGAVLVLPYWPKWSTKYWPKWLTKLCDHRGRWIGVAKITVYLNCHVFLETVCPLIVVLLFSTLVFANMVAKRDNTNACASPHLAKQDEKQLSIFDPVNIEDPEVNLSISCDESPLSPLATPLNSSKLHLVSISFIALFIKRLFFRHHRILTH